jgi:hypothetical protein
LLYQYLLYLYGKHNWLIVLLVVHNPFSFCSLLGLLPSLAFVVMSKCRTAFQHTMHRQDLQHLLLGIS